MRNARLSWALAALVAAALALSFTAIAGLDVMVQEPPAQNHPLFSLPNVTFAPHSAGPTWDNWTKAYRNGFDNI